MNEKRTPLGDDAFDAIVRSGNARAEEERKKEFQFQQKEKERKKKKEKSWGMGRGPPFVTAVRTIEYEIGRPVTIRVTTQ